MPDTPDNRLLMVMPYEQLVRKAVAAGFRVWSVWDPALREPAYLAKVAEHSEELLRVGFGDEAGLRALVAEAALRHRVRAVLHLGSETSMVPVAAEAEQLGLAPNPAAAIRLLNDKAALRELLNADPETEVAAVDAATPAEVRQVVAGRSLPAVVKPSGTSGSRGVALLRSAEDLDRWETGVREQDTPGPYLVEDYLTGPEFSVETLSFDGVHRVVGVTAKRTSGPPGFVETGHIFPAPLSDPDAAVIRRAATDLLDRSGYRFGPAHTEVILTPRGPRIVESQARLGGDRIPLLIATASGFDIERAVFDTLADGRPAEPPVPRRYAAIRFFRQPPGRLAGTGDTDAIRALPQVHALHFPYAPGDLLPPVTSSATRHGYAVVDAASPQEAERLLDQVESMLAVSVTETTGLRPEGATR
jgi:biotin carboxylase